MYHQRLRDKHSLHQLHLWIHQLLAQSMLHQMRYYTYKQEFYCQDFQDDCQFEVQMYQEVLFQLSNSMEHFLHLIDHQLQHEQFQV